MLYIFFQVVTQDLYAAHFLVYRLNLHSYIKIRVAENRSCDAVLQRAKRELKIGVVLPLK